MRISSNTEEVRIQVTEKIIKMVGPEGFKRDFKEIVDNSITIEDLVEPLAQGIKEYRKKRIKIKNITEIKNRVDRVSKELDKAVKQIKARIEKGNAVDYITEYQDKDGQSGSIVFTDHEDMGQLSRDLDRIMKELKPLARYIATEGKGRFGDIQFTLISRTTSNTKETFLFDAPVDASMRALTAKGIDIDMSQVPQKAKELWAELKKEESAATCNHFLANHLYNYRNMLNQTRKKPKDEAKNSTTLPHQWRAYAAEAFIEHMQDHESDNFTKFRRMLSGNYKYGSESALQKDFNYLKSRYAKLTQGTLWTEATKKATGKVEHAHLGWVHFIAAQGNLNGMLFGDVGRQQVKATSAQYVKEVSWKNIKTALNLIELLQENDNKPAEELAREILYDPDYAGYFVEKAINRCRSTISEYLNDSVTSAAMGVVNSSGLISRGG